MATVNLFSALAQVSVSHEDYDNLSVADTVELQRKLSEAFDNAMEEYASETHGVPGIEYGIVLVVTANGKTFDE